MTEVAPTPTRQRSQDGLRPGTQAAAVWRHLQAGGLLTCRYAGRRMGIQRLEGRICELRQRFGRDAIVTIDVTVPTRWRGRKIQIALYCLRGHEPADPLAAVLLLDRGSPAETQLKFIPSVHCPECGGAIATHNVRGGNGKDIARAACEHCGVTWRARVVAGALVSVSRAETN